MDKIEQVKSDVKIQSWAAMIKACRSSGQSVKSWCTENEISVKTYYYRLRKVREMLCDERGSEQHEIAAIIPGDIVSVESEHHQQQQIVPLSLNSNDESEHDTIRVTGRDVSVVLPQSISTDKLKLILEVLKC